PRAGCPALERGLLVGRLGARALPAALHLQLLLEHVPGPESGRQPLARDDARVVGALAAAARELRGPAGRAPRALRVQRPERAQGLHAAVGGAGRMSMEIPYTVEARPDTGLTNGKLGIWLFLASEVMLFGALFASYVMLRVGNAHWPPGAT